MNQGLPPIAFAARVGDARCAVYHDRPSLRFLVSFGTLGLAGLMPGIESGVPVWLVVGSTVLPLAAFELGAGMVNDAQSPRVRAWGVRIQLFAGVAFLVLFSGALVLQPFRVKGVWLVVALALVGVLGAALVVWDYTRGIRGRAPVAIDPFDAGERIAFLGDRGPARVRIADALAVVGGTPILMGAIGVAFVLAVLFAVVARGREVSFQVSAAAAFFSGVALVALAQGLERWETYVPSSRVRPLRESTQLLAFLLFGGALAVIGWQMLRQPGQSAVKAWLVLSGAFLCVAGGVAYVAKSALGLGVFGPRASGYELVREGLLERTRGGWYLYPWAAVRSLALADFRGMPALYVQLSSEALFEPVHGDAAGVDRARKVERKRKSLRFSASMFGAELVILPPMTVESVGELYRRALGALGDDAVRAALPSWQNLLAPMSA